MAVAPIIGLGTTSANLYFYTQPTAVVTGSVISSQDSSWLFAFPSAGNVVTIAESMTSNGVVGYQEWSTVTSAGQTINQGISCGVQGYFIRQCFSTQKHGDTINTITDWLANRAFTAAPAMLKITETAAGPPKPPASTTAAAVSQVTDTQILISPTAASALISPIVTPSVITLYASGSNVYTSDPSVHATLTNLPFTSSDFADLTNNTKTENCDKTAESKTRTATRTEKTATQTEQTVEETGKIDEPKKSDKVLPAPPAQVKAPVQLLNGEQGNNSTGNGTKPTLSMSYKPSATSTGRGVNFTGAATNVKAFGWLLTFGFGAAVALW